MTALEHESQRTVGTDGEALRVLNFSGGGFDTVMQLGVTHALLVMQGRAPDVVVGVSAGSIQAVALAEVMRAGADGTGNGSPKTYADVLGLRVARFRDFVDACHRAPEDLVDRLLPDAYQIDSFDPLVPLAQPTFAALERGERLEWIMRKSGLVRLYNDLLSLHVPIGVVTRLVRRYLGLKAIAGIGTASFSGSLKRGAVRFIEIMKLWLVIGDNLSRIGSLVPVLATPLIAPQYEAQGKTAEAIMFRFRVLDVGKRIGAASLWFLLILNLWVGLSGLVLSLPWVLAAWTKAALNAFALNSAAIDGVIGHLPLVLWGLLLLPLMRNVAEEHVPFRRRLLNYSRGVVVFGIDLFKWTATMLLLSTIPVALLIWVTRFFESLGVNIETFFVPLLLIIGGLLALLALLAALALMWMVWQRPLPPMLRTIALSAGILIAVVLVPAVTLYAVDNVDTALPSALAYFGLADDLQAALDRVMVGLPSETFPPDLTGLAKAAADPMVRTVPIRLLLVASYSALVVGISVLLSLAYTLAVALWIFRRYVFRTDSSASLLTWFTREFLDHYRLGPAIAHPYPLKRFLVDLFDRHYYGAHTVSEGAKVALGDKREARDAASATPVRRTLDEFATSGNGGPAIQLAVAVANIGTGGLEIVDEKETIIDALLAAMAVTPIFPPKKLGDKYFIDAAKIGNFPTRALTRLLRNRPVANIPAIHIYSVDPLPVTHDELSAPVDAKGQEKTTPYLNLIDIAARALQLQRFRDAKLERKLTSVFTQVLPTGVASLDIETDEGRRRIHRAYVAPIELDKPISLNKRLLFTTKQNRRDALAETIAMGCRASLQVMLAGTLDAHAAQERKEGRQVQATIRCDDAIRLYKARCGGTHVHRLPGARVDAPGLGEICGHCWIKDKRGENLAKQALLLKPRHAAGSDALPAEIVDWPPERSDTKARKPEPGDLNANGGARGPRVAADATDRSLEPARVCLFGGGVFRGVFQLGVLNALALARFKPTIAAGSSVGSITAAMAGATLEIDDEKLRRNRIGSLAAVYLAMDRLVLTDRFADFIRNWTIRASEARFSVQQADTVFRKYDFGGARQYQRDVRQVIAGLERLFYVNPYQLNDIVHAARHREIGKLIDLLKDRAQDWLDRMDVGTEILGAKPLRQLVDEFVIPDGAGDSKAVGLNVLQTQLLATATNLSRGALRVLGSKEERDRHGSEPHLIEALLASSAFPGIFRPRLSSDLWPADADEDEYVDGGLIDNLPVDPVLEELRDQARSSPARLSLRPMGGPHLIVVGSLESRSEDAVVDDGSELLRYWPELLRRTQELKFNVKLDMYESSLEDVRTIVKTIEEDERGMQPAWTPLDVKLVPVKPNWLCSTFAFHPMLGFRAINQAKSIAHGCAQTLIALSAVRSDAGKWGMEPKAIPTETDLKEAKDRQRRAVTPGKCWLVKDACCPFSKEALAGALSPKTAAWVSRIHRVCWRPDTHSKDALAKRHRQTRPEPPSDQSTVTSSADRKKKMNTDSPYRQKEPYVFVAVLVALLGAIAWTGLSAEVLGLNVAWAAILLLMIAFAVVAGRAITGYWRGILIDHRFKMDLSRLQLMAWTILVLSALFAAVLGNIAAGSLTPLSIEIPSELWVLLGISTASAVSSPLILDSKEGSKKADGGGAQVVAHNADFAAARWGDLLKGDEADRTDTVDLGKLQMFFLSFILIMSYGAAIAMTLDAVGVIKALPPVDSGMNVLLGISHTGFLATKAGMRNANA